MVNYAHGECGILHIVIYLDFHSAKRALSLVGSWSRAPDQIQMYPYWDTIGLLQLAITWYKIRHAGGQAHYYSLIGTLKQRDLNQ